LSFRPKPTAARAIAPTGRHYALTGRYAAAELTTGFLRHQPFSLPPLATNSISFSAEYIDYAARAAVSFHIA
jgi:hypothetical protein